MSKHSELLEPLRQAGYPVEPAVGSEETTCVVEFPVCVGKGIRKDNELSMWEQLSLAAFLQKHWADNQVHHQPTQHNTLPPPPPSDPNNVGELHSLLRSQDGGPSDQARAGLLPVFAERGELPASQRRRVPADALRRNLGGQIQRTHPEGA